MSLVKVTIISSFIVIQLPFAPATILFLLMALALNILSKE